VPLGRHEETPTSYALTPRGPGNFLHSNRHHAKEIFFQGKIPRLGPGTMTTVKICQCENNNRHLDTLNHNTQANGDTLCDIDTGPNDDATF
jgi:hypothetical protein